MNADALLADLILLLHFAFVIFVVGGLVAIWVGYFLRWRFVRDVRFRVAHLLAMAFVLGESLLGIICPLTTWEDKLRMKAGEMADGPASGTAVVKVAPLSVDTCRPLPPAANTRWSTGKLGARSTVPPESPDALRRSHVVPPSLEWKSTLQGPDTQLSCDEVPLA